MFFLLGSTGSLGIPNDGNDGEENAEIHPKSLNHGERHGID